MSSEIRIICALESGTAVQGHPRSLTLVAIERPMGVAINSNPGPVSHPFWDTATTTDPETIAFRVADSEDFVILACVVLIGQGRLKTRELKTRPKYIAMRHHIANITPVLFLTQRALCILCNTMKHKPTLQNVITIESLLF